MWDLCQYNLSPESIGELIPVPARHNKGLVVGLLVPAPSEYTALLHRVVLPRGRFFVECQDTWLCPILHAIGSRPALLGVLQHMVSSDLTCEGSRPTTRLLSRRLRDAYSKTAGWLDGFLPERAMQPPERKYDVVRTIGWLHSLLNEIRHAPPVGPTERELAGRVCKEAFGLLGRCFCSRIP